MSKLTIQHLLHNLNNLGLITNNKLLSYASWKNRASIHRYGKVNRIVFIGRPNDNLFAFYTVPDTDSATMKQAYEMYVKLVKGDITDFNTGTVQWTDGKIPLEYSDLN
jgi:hypothetical protein